METGSDDAHFMALRSPVTLRHMRFRLTDLDGNVVQLRGLSLSFVLYLDHVKLNGANQTRGAGARGGGARGARGARCAGTGTETAGQAPWEQEQTEAGRAY